MRKSFVLTIVLATLSLISLAQEPQVVNAKLVPRTIQAGLEQELKAILQSDKGPAWVGYAVPVVRGEHQMCCFNFDNFKNNARCCGGCRLEKADGVFMGKARDCAPLESPKNFFVLLRVSNGQIGKAQAYSVDCGLDVGGLTLYWLGEARGVESVALLEKLVPKFHSQGHDDVSQHATAALAKHADAAADSALDRLVARDKPQEVREHAAFWLGQMRGKHGLATLQQLMKSDESEDLLEHVVFAISQSKEPEAEPELIRLARRDSRSAVREKALFWLAQRAGKKVAGVITDAVEQDPDTDVKKKAVFALTQMPNDEGVPLLIQVAKTNRNPVVRKEAVFWLGQSGDSRALDFIESILTK
jgi:HEAT repeat protein